MRKLKYKALFIFRFISIVLIMTMLMSNAVVLSAAVAPIKGFINDTISKLSATETVDELSKESGAECDAESVTESKIIPARIRTLLSKLYDYDNFTENQKKALYDYVGLDYSKSAEQAEEFEIRVQALFDSLSETTKQEIKLKEIINKDKHDTYSKCTDEDKQFIYGYLSADTAKTNKIDNLMGELEKAGYDLYDSTLIMQIMAEGVFSYNESIELFSTYSNRPERDSLVRSVKDIAKFFDINNQAENNITTKDIYESVKENRSKNDYSDKKVKYSSYTDSDAFALAKKLVLQGYTKQYILAAFSVAAVLGVNPEDVIINEEQNKALSLTDLSVVEKELLTSLPVNLDAVKEKMKDKIASSAIASYSFSNNELSVSSTTQNTLIDKQALYQNLSTTGFTEINDNDLSVLYDEALELATVLFGSGGTNQILSADIEAPFSADIDDNESVTLNTGSVNYSEPLVDIPGVNGLDLELSIDYSSGNSNTEVPMCINGYTVTEWYVDIYYMISYTYDGEEFIEDTGGTDNGSFNCEDDMYDCIDSYGATWSHDNVYETEHVECYSCDIHMTI